MPSSRVEPLRNPLPASGLCWGQERAEEGMQGGKGKVADGTGPGERRLEGTPFLEVREEDLEFKAEGTSEVSVFCSGYLRPPFGFLIYFSILTHSPGTSHVPALCLSFPKVKMKNIR